MNLTAKWAAARASSRGEVGLGAAFPRVSAGSQSPALPAPGSRPGGASPPPPPGVFGAPGGHSLAQRTGQAAVGGAAAQAAGAEVVEAVQQARALVLRVAQRAHERVSARTLQGREESSRHLPAGVVPGRGGHGAGSGAAARSRGAGRGAQGLGREASGGSVRGPRSRLARTPAVALEGQTAGPAPLPTRRQPPRPPRSPHPHSHPRNALPVL